MKIKSQVINMKLNSMTSSNCKSFHQCGFLKALRNFFFENIERENKFSVGAQKGLKKMQRRKNQLGCCLLLYA